MIPLKVYMVLAWKWNDELAGELWDDFQCLCATEATAKAEVKRFEDEGYDNVFYMECPVKP